MFLQDRGDPSTGGVYHGEIGLSRAFPKGLTGNGVSAGFRPWDHAGVSAMAEERVISRDEPSALSLYLRLRELLRVCRPALL